MASDNEQTLLRDFVENRSDRAFGRLVSIHINMVFACAMRRTGDAGLSEEISQTVFTILARKAHRLDGRGGLAGWLHKTAYRCAVEVRRAEEQAVSISRERY